MPTLVDTNVLIDLFDAGSPWEDWSIRHIERVRSEGRVVINPIIYAEMAAGYPLESALERGAVAIAFRQRRICRGKRRSLPATRFWHIAATAGRSGLPCRISTLAHMRRCAVIRC